MNATTAWFAAVLLAASAPAAAQSRPIVGSVARGGDCIFQSAVSSYRVLDDRHVVLFGFGSRETFLAELAPACFDIDSQSTLATVDGDMNGQICGYGRDAISFRQMAHREECRITALERLSKARAAELLGERPEARPVRDRQAGQTRRDEDKDEDRDEAKDPPAERD